MSDKWPDAYSLATHYQKEAVSNKSIFAFVLKVDRKRGEIYIADPYHDNEKYTWKGGVTRIAKQRAAKYNLWETDIKHGSIVVLEYNTLKDVLTGHDKIKWIIPNIEVGLVS